MKYSLKWQLSSLQRVIVITFAVTIAAGINLSNAKEEIITGDAALLLQDSDRLLNLADDYWKRDDEINAEINYKKAIDLAVRAVGENHFLLGDRVNALAMFYDQKYDFDKAENLYFKSLAIAEHTSGKESHQTAAVLDNLADHYRSTGESEKAEIYARRALNIRIKARGENHIETCRSWSRLGAIYFDMCDYDEAEKMLKKTYSIELKINGENYIDTVRALSFLGEIQMGKKSFQDAEISLNEALKIQNNILHSISGKDSFEFLNNSYIDNQEKALNYVNGLISRTQYALGNLYLKTGNVTKAENCLEAAKNTLDLCNKDDELNANILNSLGELSIYKRQYDASVDLLNKAISKYKAADNNRNTYDQKIADAERKLSKALYLKGEFKNSEKTSIEQAIITQRILQKALFFKEKTRIEWQKNNLDFSYISLIKDPKIISKYVIEWKGIVLDSICEDKSLDHNYTDPELKEISNSLKSIKNQILALADKSDKYALRKLENLNSKYQELESIILSKKLNSISARKSSFIDIENIANSLSKNEMILDFFKYKNISDNTKSSYGVLRITKNHDPEYQVIEDADSIDDLILSLNRAALSDNVNEYNRINNLLSQKLTRHITEHVPTVVNRIYISPDANLNFLSFAALSIPDSNDFLINKYDIAYLSSTRDICRQGGITTNNKISLFGNPSFEAILKPITKNKSYTNERKNALSLQLNPLPGTQTECNSLKEIFELSGWKTSVYTQDNATKRNVINLEPQSIVHIASHGFNLNGSLPTSESSRGMTVKKSESASSSFTTNSMLISVDPMQSSAIAFAGANLTLLDWMNGSTNFSINDGILTASDVSALNFNGLWLVTLSACDTGTGTVQSGEGVFGLRRAFMIAGVENLLMTLWPVSDEVTPKIMADFYKEALATHDAVGSLAKVQRNWLEKLRKEKGLLAAVRDAGPFAMVMMANPNAKPLSSEPPDKAVSHHAIPAVSTTDVNSQDGFSSMVESSNVSHSEQAKELSDTPSIRDAKTKAANQLPLQLSALRESPNNREALAAVLQSLLILGRVQEVDAEVSKAIARTPSDGPFLRDMINFYAQLKKIPQALEVAQHLKKVQPDQWDVPFTIAKYELILGQRKECFGELKNAIRLGGTTALQQINNEQLFHQVKQDLDFQKAITSQDKGMTKTLQETSTSVFDSSNTTGSPSAAESSNPYDKGKIMEFQDALAKADAGDAYAQAVVSIYYALGYKSEKDLSKAVEYSSKSAVQNNPLGQYQLGVLTSGGEGIDKNLEQGKTLKVEAIEGLNTMGDDPYALAALGAMALRGEGVPKDLKKAAKLYQQSADMGYAPAQILYSMMLTKGVGVAQDTKNARMYSRKAESQNYHPM